MRDTARHVLVTGGAGFIGTHTCRALLSRGIRVRVLDNLSTGRSENLDGQNVELIEGSILKPQELRAGCEGVDSIIHLAALPSVPRSLADPIASHEANATGTLRVLEAARANRTQVVLASSSSVYGSNPALPKSEDLVCRPMSPYATSKLAAESYALAYSNCFAVPVLPFRFFNVFGPLQRPGDDYAAVVPSFVDHALRRRPIPIHGDGSQTRDFTYVQTVAQVLATAVEQEKSSIFPVNLAYGTRTSLLELVDLLEHIVARPLTREYLEARAGDVHDSQADNNRLRGLFPEVDPIPLAQGLEETVAWFTATWPGLLPARS